MVSEGQLVGTEWNCIAQLHSHVLALGNNASLLNIGDITGETIRCEENVIFLPSFKFFDVLLMYMRSVCCFCLQYFINQSVY